MTFWIASYLFIYSCWVLDAVEDGILMHFILTLIFFSQWKFMLMMRPSWLFTVLSRYLRCFFFNFCNIFVSSVDCLLLIQLMHIFIVSLCSTTFYWTRQRKTANWMTFLTHWTSIRLSFLSRVWLELLSWTSYLLGVTKAVELNKLLCSWFLLLFFIFLLYGENTYMAEFFALSS